VILMRTDGFPVEMVGGVPVVRVPEEVDITNAARLRAALIEAGGHPAFVVDMTGTRFCDSAGVQALVEAHKRALSEGRQELLATSGEAVPRIFSLTGVDRVIPSFTSLAEALQHTPAGTGPLPLLELGLSPACSGRRRSGRPSARR
jgi:anti-sigma B factor antagonist